jgi:hypothetical protein
MPERREFNGHQVKSARKITVNGRQLIRITFAGNFGKRGPQRDVSLEEYEKGVKRSFVEGKSKAAEKT